MLDFTRCLVEVAGARGAGVTEQTSAVQQQSLVADQISSLSREWRSAAVVVVSRKGWNRKCFTCCCCCSHAEQLVLYLKSAELLSGALHTAMERVRQGKLYPSATVKQGGVTSCRRRRVRDADTPLCCSGQEAQRAVQVQRGVLPLAQHSSGALLLQEASSDGSDLLHHGRAAAVQPRRADGRCGPRWQAARRLVLTELLCVQVQAAALDEMFHHGEASALRYHKALLLMEGLTLLLTERDDIISVSKCELGC